MGKKARMTGPFASSFERVTGFPSVPGSVKSGAVWPTAGPVVPAAPLADLTAQQVRQDLVAKADAQHGHAQVPDELRGAQLVVLVGAGVAARQDDALGRELADEGVGDVVRVDLAVDVRLAHAPRDQLRDLGAEVQDENLVVHHSAR